MKKLLLPALALVSTMAMANGCPGLMKSIDAKLATNPTIAAADMTKLKELRAEGEKLHKEGKHDASMKALADAKKILGI